MMTTSTMSICIYSMTNSLEADPRIMKDAYILVSISKMYGDKIMVYDSMWFYGNPVLTCPLV